MICELVSVLPALSDHSSKEARAAAYRVIRHVIVDPEGAERLQEQGLDWYIIRLVPTKFVFPHSSLTIVWL